MTNTLNKMILNTNNKVNGFISGTYNGFGFSFKKGWLEIGNRFGGGFLSLETETRIRKEIMIMLREKLNQVQKM